MAGTPAAARVPANAGNTAPTPEASPVFAPPDISAAAAPRLDEPTSVLGWRTYMDTSTSIPPSFFTFSAEKASVVSRRGSSGRAPKRHACTSPASATVRRPRQCAHRGAFSSSAPPSSRFRRVPCWIMRFRISFIAPSVWSTSLVPLPSQSNLGISSAPQSLFVAESQNFFVRFADAGSSLGTSTAYLSKSRRLKCLKVIGTTAPPPPKGPPHAGLEGAPGDGVKPPSGELALPATGDAGSASARWLAPAARSRAFRRAIRAPRSEDVIFKRPNSSNMTSASRPPRASWCVGENEVFPRAPRISVDGAARFRVVSSGSVVVACRAILCNLDWGNHRLTDLDPS